MTSRLSRLHQFLVDHFDLEELRTLCFNLSIPFDDLRGEGRSAKARELILQMGRLGQLDQLVSRLQQTRPAAFSQTSLRTDPNALDALYAELPAFDTSAGPAHQQATGSDIAQANKSGAVKAGDNDTTSGDERTSQVIKVEGGSTVSHVTQVAGDYHEHHYYPTAESPLSFLVPFMRNPDFVGREKDLEQLHQALIREGSVGIRPTGLTGMGGIGKTQLAIEYAYRYADVYPDGVFWINANEPLVKEFARLGQRLRPSTTFHTLDEQIRAVIGYIQSHTDALLILDGLADPAYLNRPVSADLVPLALPCRILFTTRRRDLGRFIAVEVNVLPEEPALTLLLRHPQRRTILDPAHPEHEDAESICDILGYLPLALEVAGTHLGRWSKTPLDAYRKDLLKRGALPVLDDFRGRLRSEDLPTRHDAAIAATLASQWAVLVSDDARLLLRVAGQLPEAAFIPVARLGLLAGLSLYFAP